MVTLEFDFVVWY